MSAVSRSRISPTMMTSGSWRSTWRSALANVSPISGRTCIWLTPGTSYSIGSSIVMIRRSVELIWRRKALSEVLLPEPVGPVTRMMPFGIVEDLLDLGLLLGAHAELVHRVGLLLLVEEAQRDRLGVDGRDRRDADVERRRLAALKLIRPSWGSLPLGDVEPRHDLHARDDRVLEAQEVLGHGDRDEEAVHPVADAQLALLGLEVDVGRLVVDGLRDHVGHEPDDGGVLVDLRLGVPLGLGRDVALVAVLERAGADAEVLDDELVDALGHRQVPDERPRREGPQPVGHRRVGQPRGGEVEGGRRPWARGRRRRMPGRRSGSG